MCLLTCIMHHIYYSEFFVIFIFKYVECRFIYLISANMSTSNPIIALLANEKLTGDNFIKWKSNMNIVLVSEDYKFVLTEKCPPQPAANATRAA